MKKLYFILTIILVTATNTLQAQNDSIYFWKNNAMIHKQSIKTADLDSITFRRPPVNPTGINIPGPNVTDIDGNTYQSVSNCGLTFTKQNLNVSKYTDGTPIPQVTDQSQWDNLTTGAWCYYLNNTTDGLIYGKLYNWYAVMGIYDAASLTNPALRKKLAPTGWHIPSDAEWTQLTNCLGGEAIAGGKMKLPETIQSGFGIWNAPNTAATNASGFSGIPSGRRDSMSSPSGFFGIGNFAHWWSSTETSTIQAWYRGLSYNDAIAVRFNYFKKLGYSVRCIKD